MRNAATPYELVEQFGIHRATVSAQLRRQGIAMRRQGLDDDGITQAVRLCEDGWSLAWIDERLGVDGPSVRAELTALGVQMRDTHGRER